MNRFLNIFVLSLLVSICSSMLSIAFMHSLLSYESCIWSILVHPIHRALAVTLSVFLGAFTLIVLRELHARGAGVENIIRDYHIPLTMFRLKTLFSKIASTIITVGGGGSGGIQGPSIYIGGFIGGFFAEKFRIGYVERKTLMLTGISSVLSTVFKTPLGAFFFAIEIPYKKDFEIRSAVPVLIGSIVGLIVSTTIGSGYSIEMPSLTISHTDLLNPLMIITYVLFGIYTALFARIFIHLDTLVGELRTRLERILGNRLLVVTVMSICVGVAVLAVPETYGTGIKYIISLLFNIRGVLENTSLIVLVSMLIVKMIATSFTIKSGASAGYFGPGIFIGGLTGILFYKFIEILGYSASNPLIYVYLGMAAFYGSVSATPIGTSILVTELTRNYFFILPSLIASLTARELMINNTLYKAQKPSRLKPDIENLTRAFLEIHRSNSEILEKPVTAMDLEKLKTLNPSDDLDRLREAVSRNKHRVFPVVEDGRFLGIIDIAGIKLNNMFSSGYSIREHIIEIPIVAADSPIKDVIQAMIDNNAEAVAIIDDEHKYLGLATPNTIYQYLLKNITNTRQLEENS